MAKGTGLVPGEGHGRKAAARRLTKPQQPQAARGGGGGVGLHLGAQCPQVGGLTGIKGADPGAAQRRQVPPAAQGRPQVPGQGPHVGPRGAGDQQVDVHHGGPVLRPGRTRVGAQAQLVDGHRARLQDHVLPAPHPGVGAHAVDLDGGHGAGDLHDLTGQVRQRGRQAGVEVGLPPGPGTRVRAATGGGDLPLGVLGQGLLAQAYGGLVGLVSPHQVGQEPGGAPHPQHQHAGGHGIQGPGVPDPAGGGQAADGGHHVVAGHPRWLVHHQETVPGGHGPPGHPRTAVGDGRGRTGAS